MAATVVCPNPACAAALTETGAPSAPASRCPRCGGPMPGRIGRYSLVEELGRGAFGTVYRAYDPQLDREVALKVLRPEALASPQAVERFQREAKAAARLFHPNIVPVHDAGSDHGRFYIASALVAGCPLARRIPAGGLDLDRAADLTAQLADALACAHAAGVVHRDVKPGNCLVDDQGRLYLTDFGLAAWLHDDGPRMTRDGAVMGTPAYMAPEQADGQADEVGPPADLYAAGVVLYELLTGALPFEGPVPSVLYQIVHEAPTPPSRRRPGLCPALEAICLKALAKRPRERHADAAELAAALRAWLRSARTATQDGDAGPTGATGDVRGPGGPAADEGRQTLSLEPPAPPPGGRGAPRRLRAQLSARFGPKGVGCSLTVQVACLLLVVGALGAWLLHLGRRPADVGGVGEPGPHTGPSVDWQPKGWGPLGDADVVVDLKGRKYYRRLVREVAGQKVVMVAVPQTRPADPRTFYIMENKVWNSLYAAFLKDPQAAELFGYYKAMPGCDKVVGGEWEKGAWVPGRADGREDLGVGGPHALLPALRMKVTEAHCFAEWLGGSRGRLPTREEYFKAAGLRELKSPEALNGDPKGLALDLGAVGPWEVTRGDRDVSPFGCRQMLTNGYEWTRTLLGDSRDEIPLQQMKASPRVFVMGTSYLAAQPPTLETINEVNSRDVTSVDDAREVGFRVVLEE
jgi:formylglycine-generating enzyme required for sulfatase activity